MDVGIADGRIKAIEGKMKRYTNFVCTQALPVLQSAVGLSLRKEGWMAEKYLVSSEELERHLDGFRINRSSVRMSRHKHGYDERILPVAEMGCMLASLTVRWPAPGSRAPRARGAGQGT